MASFGGTEHRKPPTALSNRENQSVRINGLPSTKKQKLSRQSAQFGDSSPPLFEGTSRDASGGKAPGISNLREATETRGETGSSASDAGSLWGKKYGGQKWGKQMGEKKIKKKMKKWRGKKKTKTWKAPRNMPDPRSYLEPAEDRIDSNRQACAVLVLRFCPGDHHLGVLNRTSRCSLRDLRVQPNQTKRWRNQPRANDRFWPNRTLKCKKKKKKKPDIEHIRYLVLANHTSMQQWKWMFWEPPQKESSPNQSSSFSFPDCWWEAREP